MINGDPFLLFCGLYLVHLQSILGPFPATFSLKKCCRKFALHLDSFECLRSFSVILVYFWPISNPFLATSGLFVPTSGPRNDFFWSFCPFPFNISHIRPFLVHFWPISGPFPAHFRSISCHFRSPKILYKFSIACGCWVVKNSQEIRKEFEKAYSEYAPTLSARISLVLNFSAFFMIPAKNIGQLWLNRAERKKICPKGFSWDLSEKRHFWGFLRFGVPPGPPWGGQKFFSGIFLI